MEKEVAIVGVGQSPFVRLSKISVREMCYLAFDEAKMGIRLENDEIDASIVCSASEYDKQRSPAGVIAEYLGLQGKPTFCVESLCASSSSGLRVAYSLIESGLHETVAVIGFQKMSELSSAEAAERMGRSADVMWESPFGLTMPAAFAMFARAHMAEYGTTEEQMAMVRVKNSTYGALNEKAAFRKKVTLEEVMNSRRVVTPLKMLDCCANADGAVVLILANRDVARRMTDKPIWIYGLGASSSSATLAQREAYSSIACTQKAAQIAYHMAGIGPEDIDVAEVHDCFTITEIINYEDLGFAKPGEGVRLLEEKETYLEGKIPVNPDGGLLCKGHPIGATGGGQIRTIVKQLRGECGETQVKGARVGLVHNLGGPGIYAFVTILRRDG
jgi:acetyl-CoA C-acetyltransferase